MQKDALLELLRGDRVCWWRHTVQYTQIQHVVLNVVRHATSNTKGGGHRGFSISYKRETIEVSGCGIIAITGLQRERDPYTGDSFLSVFSAS